MVSTSHSNARPQGGRRLCFELLTLGEELLLGLTANGHLTFIGGHLGRHGVRLDRNVTVSDDPAAIERQFRESWAVADVVITTGGLGPTCDDRTREVLAGVLGRELVYDREIERIIADRFARHGYKAVPPNNRKQAFRFEGSEVLPNPNGTAPGLWLEQEGKVLCLLPGPPHEMQPMFLEHVLPRLARLGLLAEREAFVQLRTAGVGESLLETKLQPVLARYGSSLEVAFCAHAAQVDCRLSSPGGQLARPELEGIALECARLLGEDFLCLGSDSLAKICGDLLRAGEQRLAVVETATAGLLANALTEACGACKFFAGGIVCCTHDAKVQLLDVPECLLQQHGGASAECAVALATGAAEALGADYALAVSGFTAPVTGCGDSQGGSVYLALYSPNGVWSKTLHHAGSRTGLKLRAINGALDWLRRELLRARHPTARAPVAASHLIQK